MSSLGITYTSAIQKIYFSFFIHVEWPIEHVKYEKLSEIIIFTASVDNNIEHIACNGDECLNCLPNPPESILIPIKGLNGNGLGHTAIF